MSLRKINRRRHVVKEPVGQIIFTSNPDDIAPEWLIFHEKGHASAQSSCAVALLTHTCDILHHRP